MMEPSQGFDPGSIPGGCIFVVQGACGHSLVVRTPRRGRGNPGSIPGDRFSQAGRSAKSPPAGFEPATCRLTA